MGQSSETRVFPSTWGCPGLWLGPLLLLEGAQWRFLSVRVKNTDFCWGFFRGKICLAQYSRSGGWGPTPPTCREEPGGQTSASILSPQKEQPWPPEAFGNPVPRPQAAAPGEDASGAAVKPVVRRRTWAPLCSALTVVLSAGELGHVWQRTERRGAGKAEEDSFGTTG